MNKYDKKYIEKQIKTVEELRKLYDAAIKKIIAGIPLSKLSSEEQFAFEKYPDVEKRFNVVSNNLNIALLAYINQSTHDVWNLANEKNDDMLNKQFEKQDAKPPPDAMKTHIREYERFQNRKISDLTLSDRVWKNDEIFRKEIELAVNAAIEQGKSADDLARDIRKYLNNPDALFRRVRDKDGNLRLSKAAREYHPGQGVYRSAYKNAKRLARNEINMAYRESDYLRWQENDSIIGFRIQNSNRESTVCELCKRFNGLIFPKTFKWLGFHVQCMCTAIAIFAPQSEIDKYMRGENINPELPKMPEDFVKYQDELSTKQNIRLFDLYKKFKGGGRIEIINGYSRGSDHKDLVSISRFFAQNGDNVKMTTPTHYKDEKYKSVFGSLIGTKYERKCPDLIINGKYYEYESYRSPFRKEKISNMLNKGSAQSSRIIINNNKGASDRYIRRNIIERQNDKNFKFDFEEVWLYEKGKVRLLYKKQ